MLRGKQEPCNGTSVYQPSFSPGVNALGLNDAYPPRALPAPVFATQDDRGQIPIFCIEGAEVPSQLL